MSPDEITLVNAAKKVGYEFRYRSNKEIEIYIGGVKQKYNLLKLFSFTSDRKRMTIVVQDPEDPDFVYAFTKGADNVMKDLSIEQFNSHFDFSYIDKFAKKGYRTLIVGMKVIRYDEYIVWEQEYDELNKQIDQDNTKELDELVSSIEQDLFLLGTTALEDKLQENVHECIEEFRRAEIKVWMITGDKLETAENVGVSCRLLHEDADRFFFTADTDKEARKQAMGVYKTIKRKMKERKQKEGEESEYSDEEFEREVHSEPQAIEENKVPNQSHDSYRETNVNSLMKQKPTYESQYVVPDLLNTDKKLKITEKKLYVKQILMTSSLNTSFNLTKSKAVEAPESNFEVVIEGHCLSIMLKEENRKLFGKIIMKAAVVLVCRASPKQKAEVIEFAKSLNPKLVSLAIGDGGNDVSMIKAADVGIGIFGKEGYQAVTASDYAIGEFQFLRRLMFIHGRFNVRRITVFITQFLIKNLIFSLSQLIFAFYSGYSGQTFFEPGYVSVFNMLSSQLAVCYYACYDQDINPKLKDKKTKLLLPYMYTETREKTAFNVKDFVTWYGYALWVGVGVYYISYYSYLKAITEDGLVFGLWQFSFCAYVAVCVINLVYVCIYIQAWNWATFVFVGLHIVLFYPGWVLLYDQWPDSYLYRSHLTLYWHSKFFLTWFVIISLAVFPVTFMRRGKAIFFPKLVDLILSKRVHKFEDIEDKLRIDMVKLAKDLDSDSDSDETVRLPGNNTARGTKGAVATTTIDNGTNKMLKSEASNLEGKSEISDIEYRDDISSFSNDAFSKQMSSGFESGMSDVYSSSVSNLRQDGDSRLMRSIRSNGSNTPTVERFAGSFKEFKSSANPKDNMDRLGTNYRNKGSKRKQHKRKRNKSIEQPKFHPHMSSVGGGDTIQEKSDEEDDPEEQIEKYNQASSSQEPSEESSRQQNSSNTEQNSSQRSELFTKRVNKNRNSEDESGEQVSDSNHKRKEVPSSKIEEPSSVDSEGFKD